MKSFTNFKIITAFYNLSKFEKKPFGKYFGGYGKLQSPLENRKPFEWNGVSVSSLDEPFRLLEQMLQ